MPEVARTRARAASTDNATERTLSMLLQAEPRIQLYDAPCILLNILLVTHSEIGRHSDDMMRILC